MAWNTLSRIEDLDAIAEASQKRPQLLFKHSTRCSISDVAWKRLEDATEKLATAADLHFLDLIAFREVSNAAAKRFGVPHESPQTLLIHHDEVLLDQSHMGVRSAEILEVLQTKDK